MALFLFARDFVVLLETVMDVFQMCFEGVEVSIFLLADVALC